MDEQMIADIAKAIWNVADADGYALKMKLGHDDAMKMGRAAHSVIAGKVAELEEQRNRLLGAISWIEPQFVNSKTRRDELFSRIRFCVADAARACPAALAPYPERRSE